MNMKTFLFALIILVVVPNCYAEKIEGTFTAIKSCPAYKSFRKGHNPGDIQTVPGRTYEAVEVNKENGAWTLVLVPEISESRRWVAKECGTLDISPDSSPERPPVIVDNNKNDDGDDGGSIGGKCNTANTYDSNVLALSWQAGFCEHYGYSGIKPECEYLNSGQIIVTNITIHGLWPNKDGCGHSYGNCSNERLNLEEDTVSIIAPWMPNWFYSDDFGSHEWTKHGTCQERSDDDYFLLIKELAEKFDKSSLGDYLRTNIGETVSVAEMESYLSAKLGKAVTKHIELRCTGSGKRFVNEFWVSLPKKIDPSATLDELVRGAAEQPKFQGNCAKQIYIEAPGPN
ncbi:MAG: hypothetical protein OEV64_03455 [Desulfobulbaceae bacterium]|nr:hypothetical protein [Desulfobulbaceae bacterium]